MNTSALTTLPIPFVDCYKIKTSSATGVGASDATLIQEDDFLIFFHKNRLTLHWVKAQDKYDQTRFSELKSSCLLKSKGEIEPLVGFYLIKQQLPSIERQLGWFTFPLVNLGIELKKMTLNVPDWEGQRNMTNMFNMSSEWLLNMGKHYRKKGELLEQMADAIANELILGKLSLTELKSHIVKVHDLDQKPPQEWQENGQSWVNPEGQLMVPLSAHLEKVAELEEKIKSLQPSVNSSSLRMK